MQVTEVKRTMFNRVVVDGRVYYRFEAEHWEMQNDDASAIVPVPGVLMHRLENAFLKHVNGNPQLVVHEPVRIVLDEIPDAMCSTEVHSHLTILSHAHMLKLIYGKLLGDKKAADMASAIVVAATKSTFRSLGKNEANYVVSQASKAGERGFKDQVEREVLNKRGV